VAQAIASIMGVEIKAVEPDIALTLPWRVAILGCSMQIQNIHMTAWMTVGRWPFWAEA